MITFLNHFCHFTIFHFFWVFQFSLSIFRFLFSWTLTRTESLQAGVLLFAKHGTCTWTLPQCFHSVSFWLLVNGDEAGVHIVFARKMN